jgi:hypothetical protein
MSNFMLAKDVRENINITQKLITNCLEVNKINGKAIYGGTTAGGVFVFRPGYTGPATEGIYTVWQDLYDNLIQIPGYKVLYFDDTDGSIIIPAAATPWDMTDTVWQTLTCVALTGPVSVTITISDGATIKNLCYAQGVMVIDYKGTTQPCMVYDPAQSEPVVLNTTSQTLLLRDGAAIKCSGAREFLRVVSGLYILILDFGGQIQSDAYEPIFTKTSGFFAVTAVIGGKLSTLSDNTVRGPGNFSILKIDLTFNSGATSVTQPNLTGTYSYSDSVSASVVNYTPSNVLDWNNDPPFTVANALDRIAAAIGPIL